MTKTKCEGSFAHSGGTILAAMNTLMLMSFKNISLKKEFQNGRQWIKNTLNFAGLIFDQKGFSSTPFIVNHVIGSLLSNYYYTRDAIFWFKAKEIDQQIRSNENNITTSKQTSIYF